MRIQPCVRTRAPYSDSQDNVNILSECLAYLAGLDASRRYPLRCKDARDITQHFSRLCRLTLGKSKDLLHIRRQSRRLVAGPPVPTAGNFQND